ncbi:MAG: YkgJ family cysteine cluster protein [Deltaproteobacteria bacterium]|nr:YkgJ family cysteine cluster protein [Deltaproteobacteria bacterium]
MSNWKCSRCGSCCQSDVVIFDEDVASVPEQYRTCEHIKIGDVAVEFWSMKMKADGFCAAYKDGQCLIYEHRPVMCRIIECSHDPQLRRSQALDALDAALHKEGSHAAL